MRVSARPYSILLKAALLGVAALALAHLLAVLFIFSQRAAYPFDLEWVENPMLENVSRVMRGASVYPAPSLNFAGELYTPLFYFAGAGFAAVFGEGLPALRLVSILATLGSFGLIGLLVWRGSGSRVMALIAAGCFAATYEPSGVTFDLARTDSLSLLALLAGFGGQWRLRRMALVSAGVSSLIAALFLQACSGGQAWQYILVTPSQHPVFLDKLPQFLGRELLNTLPVLAALALAGAVWLARKKEWFWLALLAGGVMASALPRIKLGGSINTLMPAYAVIIVVACVTLGRLARGQNAVPLARAALCLLALMGCGYQLVRLRYDPTRHIPTSAEFAQRQRMVDDIRQINGEVWVPAHSVLARLAGKPAFAHTSALSELAFGDAQTQARDAVAQGRFAAILIDPRRDAFIREWINPDTYQFEEKFATPPRPEQSTLPTWWYYAR